MLEIKLKDFFKDVPLEDIPTEATHYTVSRVGGIITYSTTTSDPLSDYTPDREYGWYRKFEKVGKNTNKRGS
jgi:hypothetical protein